MNKKPIRIYKNLFFDIDRTLWNYRVNSEQALKELLHRYTPQLDDVFSEFLSVFYRINEGLWSLYRDGKIGKETLRIKRFSNTFAKFGIDNCLFCNQFADDYIKVSPYKTNLYPNTVETLKKLRNKGYKMYLLTNGFKEVQDIKIRESGIEQYFDKMITSEESGYQKPARKMFEYALKTTNSKKDESIMIGDDIKNDILGAKQFGMGTILFNPEKKQYPIEASYQVTDISDLLLIL